MDSKDECAVISEALQAKSKDAIFFPVFGLVGANMKSSWDVPLRFEALDSIEVPIQDPSPFRMPITDKFKEMGTVVMGKVESGSVREGDSLLVMPKKIQVKVVDIYLDEEKVKYGRPGKTLYIRLSGIDAEDISYGFILSSIERPIHAVTQFVAQLQIIELPHNEIFTAGYQAVLHIHDVVEHCEIADIVSQMDPKTEKPMEKKPLFVKNDAVINCVVQMLLSELAFLSKKLTSVKRPICIEKFADFPQLGRFKLRFIGKTVAEGKVVSLS